MRVLFSSITTGAQNVRYPTNYSSLVLTNNEGEDELNSSEVHGHLAAIVENVHSAAPNSLNLLKADSEFAAPMNVPHMFWWALASPPDVLPLQFHCLIDVGSYLVIIHDQLVNDLKLHCCKLCEPLITKLVMQPDGPKILEF